LPCREEERRYATADLVVGFFEKSLEYLDMRLDPFS